MNLVTLRAVQHGYGGPPLLENVDFSITTGERVCLIGRNGEGKSTLMRIIAGEIVADSGERAVGKGVRIARLTQEVPQDFHGKVFSVVASALGQEAQLINDYHAAVQLVSNDPSDDNLQQLSRIQHDLESRGGWQLEQQVETVISRLSLPADADVASLSGGLKRRVLLARALATDPDLLLLDEPTNHLDIESIQWLEQFLIGWPGALLFVTHDREFLRHLATRIVELDRGGLTDWPGDYDNYLRRREERLHAEQKQNERFDKKLAQEEVWIRQGIKARRTRNEGRVRALKSMREDYRQRRAQQGQARLRMQQGEQSGKLVCEAEHISYRWDGKPIVRDFSTTILRGDKIGVIGPNGAGKTTLLRLLLGQLPPDEGQVRLGSKLEVVFFDQLRGQINDAKSVQDNVAEGSDKVVVNGQEKHILSYLQDFLFSPQRARQPAKALSGGERNRLLLAKLFLKPANLLVLDEPTNDLDVETLELLEELLLDYQGTLILVSHDREFLDNVVTATLVFEGDGRVGSYVGGYSDWQRQQQASLQQQAGVKANPARLASQDTGGKKAPATKSKKLSYKLQRELEQLPQQIEQLEQQQTQLQQQLSDPAIYRGQPERIPVLQQEMAEVEAQLESCFVRWEELEAMKEPGTS
ncbi:MAG: ATP-binding cassette domain-containing protein [Chromatiales bacterium]|jgi:ATP-binding cassette subfamily F protein uup